MKRSLRDFWRAKRRAVSKERRNEASQKLVEALSPLLEGCESILSYASLEEELDTFSLNTQLAGQKRLILPRVDENTLRLYAVDDMRTQLLSGKYSIKEPSPDLCREVTPDQVSIALIPAIAFDSAHHRIGYGRGHYDRLLSDSKVTFPTIGIGFVEQYSEDPFPCEEHDIALTRILLV